VIPDEAGQQRILDRRRREIAAVGRMQHRICFLEVIDQSYARAGLHAGVHQIKIVAAQPEVDGQIGQQREVVLDVGAGLPAEQSPP
jgi:hypothetical protein